MLLMQYNDNIPAVFGFPLVIPHQRRGGREEEDMGERTVLGNALLFLSFSPSSLSALHCSFLHLVLPVTPGVYCRAQQRLSVRVYLTIPVYIHG